MAEKSSDLPVRIIGSRELHQNLPTILRELERNDVRYVLTVHGKPRAVLVGAEPYMNMVLDRKSPSEALVGLQLSALLGETLNPASLEDLEKALEPEGRNDGPIRPSDGQLRSPTWPSQPDLTRFVETSPAGSILTSSPRSSGLRPGLGRT